MLMATKSEVQDMQQEHQREMEALLESVRQISSEVKRLSLICDYFIPHEYLQLIQEHTHWNDEIGEWQLVCYCFTIFVVRSREFFYLEKIVELIEWVCFLYSFLF